MKYILLTLTSCFVFFCSENKKNKTIDEYHSTSQVKPIEINEAFEIAKKYLMQKGFDLENRNI